MLISIFIPAAIASAFGIGSKCRGCFEELSPAMLITVVTVCFNSQATIARAVQSFLSQSHPAKELLVIDGSSTDCTLNVVRSFPQGSIRIISEKDRGMYDAMNKGLAQFSGDAVGFLNSDDAFHDSLALKRIAEALENADAAYGDLNMVDAKDGKSVRRVWKAGTFVPGSFRKGWMPPHPTFYISRLLAEKTGSFRQDFRISADYDFMLRALEVHKPHTNYIPHTLIDFTLGGRSTEGVRAVIDGNLECLRSRREYLGAPWIDAAFFLKPAKKLLQVRRGGHGVISW